MKKLLILFFVFIISIGTTNAWIGLIAQNGDILNISKWNEMIVDKLSKINLKSGTGIVLTNSGDDIFINLDNTSNIPYISTTQTQLSLINATSNISFNGSNFTPNSILSIPNFPGIINSVSVLSPNEIIANITTSSIPADYDIVISNGGTLNTLWAGNGQGLLRVTDFVLGTGLAGTYLENFETGLGSWVNSGLAGTWTRDSLGTPSAGTGPNTGALGSTWYMFTEVSNGLNVNPFGIETSDFRRATNISLDYHMFGNDIGTLYIQTLHLGVWTTVWSISGQQQALQTDAYINTGPIDISNFQVEKIRIRMDGASSWGGDTAVDNISITSI